MRLPRFLPPLRRLLVVFAGLLLIAAAADFLVWRWAVGRLESGLNQWAAAQRAEGWTVAWGRTVPGGWPAQAALTIADLRVTGAAAEIPGGLGWDTDRLTLSVSFLHPSAVVALAGGAQRLRLGTAPPIPFTADRFSAMVPLIQQPDHPGADFAATNLRIAIPTNQGRAAGLTVAALRLRGETMPGAAAGQAAIGFDLATSGIGLPPDLPWPLGARIAAFSARGVLNGPLAAPAASMAAAATAWRDGGGRLRFDQAGLEWGPLGVQAHGTLRLDAELQPVGAADARISGYAEALDALGASGVITRGAATAAKAVLLLVAHRPEQSVPASVELPLSLEDRIVALGRIPLARLPEISWPAN